MGDVRFGQAGFGPPPQTWDRMGVVYSRDRIIGPLGGVIRMVDAIREKTWDPDSPRCVLLWAAMVEKKDTGGVGAAGPTQ
eukprot:1827807-Amphidinium_carterae.1